MRALCCLLLALAAASGALAEDAPRSREYQLKTAFLYSFTKFVEWPAQSFSDARAPFVIGVMAQPSFAAQIERAMQDREIKGRDIRVQAVDTLEQYMASHLVFVGAGESGRYEALQSAAASAPILTVGESAEFARAGGIINFVVEKDRVRFEINMASASRAGLQVSSQLQKLAIVVRDNS